LNQEGAKFKTESNNNREREKMRLAHLIVVLSIIMLFPISESVIIVHAKTLTIDCGETTHQYADSDIRWSFNVTMTVQTEQNGNWIVNNTYEVDWGMKLTYLNESIYDRDSFSIVCYDPQNYLSDNIRQNCTIYETTVTPDDSGTLSMKFTPIATMNYELDTAFGLKVFDKAGIRGSGSWQQDWQNEPIPISIEKSQAELVNPSIDPIYAYLAIAGVIIVIGIGTFLLIRKGKRND
jgi:hypothetical protein